MLDILDCKHSCTCFLGHNSGDILFVKQLAGKVAQTTNCRDVDIFASCKRLVDENVLAFGRLNLPHRRANQRVEVIPAVRILKIKRRGGKRNGLLDDDSHGECGGLYGEEIG